MEYTVVVREILEKEIIVNAEDKYEAIEKVKDRYYNGDDDLILDADCHVDTIFECNKMSTEKD